MAACGILYRRALPANPGQEASHSFLTIPGDAPRAGGAIVALAATIGSGIMQPAALPMVHLLTASERI